MRSRCFHPGSRGFPGRQVSNGTAPGQRSGSVSARASKYSWFDEGRDFSGGLQHPQNRCGAAKEIEPAVVGGDLLIGSGAGTEEVAQLVVGATEFASRSWALEPAHRTVAAFDAAMILLQSVIEILAIAMPDTGPQGRPDRTGITVMPICGHSVRRATGDHLGRLQERLRGGHIAALA